MTYLLVGAVILVLLFWGAKPGRILKSVDWRAASAILSIGLFAAALFVGVRGGWVGALMLIMIGVWLALSSRWPRAAGAPDESSSRMSLAEARSLLGVSETATTAEIQAAYARLIQMAHPDKGGTSGLAAQLNAARDRLLNP